MPIARAALEERRLVLVVGVRRSLVRAADDHRGRRLPDVVVVRLRRTRGARRRVVRHRAWTSVLHRNHVSGFVATRCARTGEVLEIEDVRSVDTGATFEQRISSRPISLEKFLYPNPVRRYKSRDCPRVHFTRPCILKVNFTNSNMFYRVCAIGLIIFTANTRATLRLLIII